MKVLSVASEVFPLVKTGGLADVAGALPPALKAHGVAMTTMIPGYPVVMKQIAKATTVVRFDNLLGAKGKLLAANRAGLDLLVLDVPGLFDRDGGPYADMSGNDHVDNWRRFAIFSRAAALVAMGAIKGYRPDVVHVHDWQAALTLAYLRYGSENVRPASVVTVHNLAFQGRFAASVFGELQLPKQAWSIDGVEYYGGVGFLKAGLQMADAITAVSPSYAREIRTPEFGMGLEGLLNGRTDALHGIVNGIDTDIWNPEMDPHLAVQYSARTLKRRAANKCAISERFGLVDDDDPVLAVVSRLTWQKGIDILAQSIDAIVARGAKLAVLGSGDKGLENELLAAAARHRGRVGIIVGYDEPLSHLVQGGADAILVPSRFEPCGLTQLYGLRYGCIPVVARTGGLADTIIDANAAALGAGVATGFQIAPLNPDTLTDTISRAVTHFHEPKTWAQMQKNGMKTDVSWNHSARLYADLYRSLVHED
ncbi:MAG: glycogen synthase GlgA [Notoacmeibacter sp.]|nr:glycogen synthase GlgA [Notoacmeibacter sp.]